MASTSGGTHGGKRESSGRKRKFSSGSERKKAWDKGHKKIYLSMNIFKTWNDAKIEAGYQACSDDDFAAHLIYLEYRRRYD